MPSNRLSRDVDILYQLLGDLETKLGGKRKLASCTARDGWPVRGVYFFFEPGEARAANPTQLRVVRVGTHALKKGAQTTLWNRLSQHRGTSSGAGNHRGSIFRLHVGAALIERARGEIRIPSWGIGSSASREITGAEGEHERLVSAYIGQMPFLWLAVDDAAGPQSERGYLERNLIALLSGGNGQGTVDPPGAEWLGRYTARETIRTSGLWNVNHVGAQYDPDCLLRLEHYVRAMPVS